MPVGRWVGCWLRGIYAAPKRGRSSHPLFSSSTCRPARSSAGPGDLKGHSRGTPGHAGASFSFKVILGFPHPSRHSRDTGSLFHAGAVTVTLPKWHGLLRVPRAALRCSPAQHVLRARPPTDLPAPGVCSDLLPPWQQWPLCLTLLPQHPHLTIRLNINQKTLN